MNYMKILSEAVKDFEFYTDAEDEQVFYMETKEANSRKSLLSLETKKAQDILYMKTMEADEDGNGINGNTCVKILRADFACNGLPPKIHVYKRIAGNLSSGIEYDLCDSKGQSVHITEGGWKIAPHEAKFITPSLAQPQVSPKKTKTPLFALLSSFVNLKGKQFKLFVLWVVQIFCSGSCFAILLMAEKGSGKSMLCRIIKKIADPGKVDICHKPKKLEDLAVLLSNCRLVCLDNIGSLSKDESDLLCGAITGSTDVKRSLYTNNELSVSTLHNVVVINAVSTIPGEADLAERFLLFKLNKISGDQLETEEELWAEFNENLPYVLGAIFDTLAKAMQIKAQKTQIGNKHRLVDAFIDLLCIAEALGISETEYREMFDENIAAMNSERGDIPVVEAVKEFMARQGAKRTESGTSSEMYQRIRSNYSGDKNLLPRSAAAFSKKLNLEKDSLAEAGINISIIPGALHSTMTIHKK